jgi:hypothetical protein
MASSDNPLDVPKKCPPFFISTRRPAAHLEIVVYILREDDIYN